jgi:hypothetical protein
MQRTRAFGRLQHGSEFDAEWFVRDALPMIVEHRSNDVRPRLVFRPPITRVGVQ